MFDPAICIDAVRARTDSVVLFHSLTGKDSIMLLDLVYPKFKRVVCVYMYVVKDMDYTKQHIAFIYNKYPKVQVIQIPHYSIYSNIKVGYMGCAQNPKQKLYKLSDLAKKVTEVTGIEWALLGFKKSDSMNRRLMLNSIGEPYISEKGFKAYPLADLKNADVLSYIEDRGIIKPLRYDTQQSSGEDITSVNFLMYLKHNYPQDLKKIFAVYPMAERILFEYENAQDNREPNDND